ncbi:hypothetical protein CLOHYLEM_04180 [[Clostridium] hylemonae DSM 15053]|uniref:Uncharacterized protein n=1 Tax=[Clostridium] hylemonae DSM 15053 TaxID=553973 RepID=C0BWJ7_9FIRM|nr:hypothetical protein CLOHYLEM_04180 [[Clostridium] hylemonae DSM 15053]
MFRFLVMEQAEGTGVQDCGRAFGGRRGSRCFKTSRKQTRECYHK